jgi:sugar-phosphatase
MIELKCEALIFDLDGVLVDSAAAVEHAWSMWANQHSLDVHTVMTVAHGRRTLETVGLMAPHLNAVLETEQIEAKAAIDPNGVMVMGGAVSLLRSIPPRRWAIATSGTHGVAVNRIQLAGLPMPQVLVTGNDVRKGKPDPEPYLLAASRLGVNPEACVVFEDAPAGIQSGRSAGMRVIAIASTHAVDGLGHATVIARQLTDIHVLADKSSTNRLIVRVQEMQ